MQRDAARGAEAHVGIRAIQGFEHGCAAHHFGGEQFERFHAVFQRQLHFARRGNPGDERNVRLVAGFGERFVQTGADGERRTRIGNGFQLFFVNHRARAHNRALHFLFNQADGIQARGRAQRDFQRADAACHQGVRQINGGGQIVNRHHGHNGAGGENFAGGQFGHDASFMAGWKTRILPALRPRVRAA